MKRIRFHRLPRLRAVALGLALCGAAAGSARADAPRFAIRLLPPAAGDNASQGQALNASAQVAGQSSGTHGTLAAAWRAPDYAAATLGDLDGASSHSSANGINDAGTVVGTGTGANGQRAFLLRPGGAMIDLGELPGGTAISAGLAINDAETVAGYSYSQASQSAPVATVWLPGGAPLEIGDFDGGAYNSQARAVNEAGMVAGVGSTVSGRHAFTWTIDGGLVDLGDLAGGAEAGEAWGINDAGWVVGQGSVGIDGTARTHAALWHDGMAIDLGGGAATTTAYDINNGNWIVGSLGDHAALWDGAQNLFDLNALVDGLPTGFVLDTARAINDAGWITGWGHGASGFHVGFVLSPLAPVPEAPAAATLLAGLSALGWLARRRAGFAGPF